MQHEMIPSASNRPQHPFFNLFGAQLYQPIGFMNTRLTYAGLMIIILPYTFAKIFNETGLLRTGRKISLLIFIAGILILIFNNSRSAQAGILAAVLISIPSIVYLRPFRINRICIPGFLLFMTAGLLASGIYLHIHPEKLPSLENKITRYTDYQRPIIWKGSWELFLESPITGAGPGQFTAETYRIREIYVSLYPELLYFSNNTPAGHAHNDFLHLLSVGGIFAGVFYLAVLLITAGFLFKNKLISKTSGFIQEDFTAVFLSTGVIAVFIAGLAQCYFQDDETVAVIWTAIALISASENSGHRTLHFD
ncbi:MAG: O-antigen ligase family protein [Spirochaetia bacterium]|nr:O-antigen ligase family protein [Spirochaetia bacterium]